MSIITAFAIYFLIWWVVFFAMLPIGVRTAREEGAAHVPGQADSAPTRPDLGRKALWTSAVSAVLFALFWLAARQGWLPLLN
jgi:predicted secreted protein